MRESILSNERRGNEKSLITLTTWIRDTAPQATGRVNRNRGNEIGSLQLLSALVSFAYTRATTETSNEKENLKYSSEYYGVTVLTEKRN